MDKSSLALKAEVVKTVNGIQPDDDGNVVVEVEEQEPEVVQSSDEFVDTSKKYVLDNYIYAYRKRFIKGGTTPNFTSQLPISINPLTENEILENVGYKQGVRYKVSDSAIQEETISYNVYSTGLIPVKIGDVIRINAMGYHTGLGANLPFVNFVRADKTANFGIAHNNLSAITTGGGKYAQTGTNANGLLSDVEIHINSATLGWVANAPIKYVYFMIWNTTPPENVIITVI